MREGKGNKTRKKYATHIHKESKHHVLKRYKTKRKESKMDGEGRRGGKGNEIK